MKQVRISLFIMLLCIFLTIPVNGEAIGNSLHSENLFIEKHVAARMYLNPNELNDLSLDPAHQEAFFSTEISIWK